MKFYTHTFCGGGRLFWEKKGDFGGGREVENGGEEAAGSEGVGQELTPTHLTPGAPSPRTLLQAAFWQLVFPPRTTLGFVTAWEVLGMCISVALDTLSQQAAAWTSSVNPSRCVLTQPAVLSQYGGFFWESQLSVSPKGKRRTLQQLDALNPCEGMMEKKTLQGKGARELEHYFYTILKKYKFLL